MNDYSVNGQVLLGLRVLVKARNKEEAMEKAKEICGEIEDVKGREGDAVEIRGMGELIVLDDCITFFDAEKEEEENVEL
ncbi:MAG: hypothetical protein PHN44_10895 [Candidatus Marinimicrobia bacterium]|nr:hypothetical protein [Candidatus Neomarinimicrobiota bacterium]